VEVDDADDFEAAPLVSLLYEPTPRFRIGVVYLGETDLKLDGDVNVGIAAGLDADFDLDLPLAQAVRLHAVWEASDMVSLFFSARWEDWGELDTTAASINGGSFTVPLEFRDTWGGGVGVEVKTSERWTLQTGINYDSSPYKNSKRLALLPIDRTIRLGFGMLHDYSESTQLGFAFNYLNLGKAKLDQPSVSGQYDENELFLLAFNVNWSKLPWSGKAQF
jgi:long-chain fatty acid transport protein